MPFCSIVQSLGMGKSRLVDQFSTKHFLIPINLRNRDTYSMYKSVTFTPLAPPHLFPGFPPPDHAIRNLLTSSTKEKEEKTLMQHFLVVLFEKTQSILENELTDANNRSERITKFREYMRAGMDIESVGPGRQKFYDGIAEEVLAVSPVYLLTFVFLYFTEERETGQG